MFTGRLSLICQMPAEALRENIGWMCALAGQMVFNGKFWHKTEMEEGLKRI